MNFYKRFIGDIQAKTGHLSLAEFGAYDRLLDHCYSTEQPLPADVDSVCRIARAMTREERKAVESVLRQFFKLTDDGYVQPRVLEMLAEAQPKIEANRENGKKGGRPRSKSKETEQKPTGFSVGTQSEPNENLSQSQSQITLSSLRSDRDKPRKRGSPSLQKPMATVDDLVAAGFHPNLAVEFINHKASLKAPLTVRAWHDHLSEARKAGWSPAQAAEKVIARNWKGFDASYVLKDRPPSSQSMNAHKHAAAAKAIFDGVFDD